MLGTCTGGADYYDELAGPALERANFLINRVPWTTGTDPYKALSGGTYQRDSRDHIFGCLIAPLIPKEIRANSLAPVAKIGVYLGSSEKTPGAIILAQITFDYEHMRWVLHAPEEATSYKAFDSIFPLRLLPTAGGRTLDQFMEGVIPWHKQSPIPEGITVTGDNIGASSGVYKVRKILDREKRKGGYHYLVGWAGYGAEENSWEPRRNLVKYGSTQLVEKFDATRKTTLKSQLCQARGEDAAGRTSTLMDEVYRFMEAMEMPVYQAERAQRAAEAASQGITEMPVQDTVKGKCLTSSQRRARLKRVEKTCFQLYVMTRSQREADRATDPPLRRHGEGQGTGATEMTGNQAPTEAGQEAARDLPGGQTYETVAKLMRDSGFAGDPLEFTQGYNKELATVKAIRLKEISTSMGSYARTRRMAVRLKMLLERKKDGRCKARLVLKGFQAPAWWRVGSTDSPVVATASLRAMIFRRNRKPGEVLSAFDFETAFLQADSFGAAERTKHVKFRPHPGYPEEVFELTGPLYGSDDAPMRFFNTVAPWLISMGFTQGRNDPCLFSNEETGVCVGLHVDDGLVRGTVEAQATFYEGLALRFKFKTPTYLTATQPLKFVGMTVSEYQNEGGQLCRSIDCTKDTMSLLEAAAVSAPEMKVRIVKCPMPDSSEIASNATDLGSLEATFYRMAVGQIQYLSHMVRYDVAHAVSRLGQYNQKPTEGSRLALMRVLGYMGGSADFKIEGTVEGEPDKIAVYSDSDHGGDKHLTTRSQSGTMILLNGVPVHWRSSKQPVTALSSAEAEIYALSEAIKSGRLFQWRCEEADMQVEWPMNVMVDNTQSISFQQGTCVNSKLRGTFDMRLKWVGEVKNTKEAQAVYVPRADNFADVLTHCLSSGNFNRAIDRIKHQHTGMSLTSLMCSIGRYQARQRREGRQAREPLRRIACMETR